MVCLKIESIQRGLVKIPLLTFDFNVNQWKKSKPEKTSLMNNFLAWKSESQKNALKRKRTKKQETYSEIHYAQTENTHKHLF